MPSNRQKVVVGPAVDDKPVNNQNFAISEVVIVTHVPVGHTITPGAAMVVGVNGHGYFLGDDKGGSWTSEASGYRARSLRPGETVTITGA